MNTDTLPDTLQDAITYFADAERALAFMKALRWPDGIVRCNRCESDNVLFLATARRWKCRACKNQFSAKVGTVFEDSPLGLDKWIPAVWVIVNAKNGVSSCELARSLGVTQKTAWFMLHRIRLGMQGTGLMRLGGIVEVDETYIGGTARMMNAKQKAKRKKGTGYVSMSPVQGLLERNKKGGRASRVILRHVEGNHKRALDPNVRHYVLKGSEVHTDELLSYDGLGDEYTHKVINHAECYAKGNVHTNGLENFWCLLKRALKGTYVSVEPFHLFRYLDEQAFRFNERKHEDGDKGAFSWQSRASSAADSPTKSSSDRMRTGFRAQHKRQKRGPKTKAHKACRNRLANALKCDKRTRIMPNEPDWEARWNDACKRTGYIPSPPRPATLLVDGQAFSTGSVLLAQGDPTGAFQPQDGKILDTPIPAAVLMLRDTQETIAVADVSPCPTGQAHFHFRTVQLQA